MRRRQDTGPAVLLPLLLCLQPSTCMGVRQSWSSHCDHLHYWHSETQTCIPCEDHYSHHIPLHGREFTVNCGMLDEGGRFATPSEECPHGSFNNGQFLLCQNCTKCPAGAQLTPCTRLQDTQCCFPGYQRGPDGSCQPRCCFPNEQCHPAVQATINCTRPAEASPGPPTGTLHSGRPMTPTDTPDWYFTLMLVVMVVLVVGALVFSQMRCSWCMCHALHPIAKHHPPSPMLSTEEETSLTAPPMVPGGLWGVPLQRLLDNADMLEQLIMLLDPEGKAGGGTRHLAARYGLSATWIDYTYSLRSTRSPLRATLETVAARQPDATVGQLAKLLAAIGRKDALQVLEGLQQEA